MPPDITNTHSNDTFFSSAAQNYIKDKERSEAKTRGVVVGTSYISRLRHRSGIKKATTKYRHTMWESNKQVRLDSCSGRLAAGMTFSDCVSVDECTVQIDCSRKYCFVKRGGQYSRVRISGTTQFAFLPGTSRIDTPFMSSVYNGLFCSQLNTAFLLCFFSDTISSGFCRVVQDSWRVRRIDRLQWAAESPHLNSIEVVWGNMKNCIRKRGVRNSENLKVAIAQYWKTLTPEICMRYISGIRKRMERVVEQEGRNIIEDDVGSKLCDLSAELAECTRDTQDDSVRTVAEDLKVGKPILPQLYTCATVLFSDIRGESIF
ncbi:unnamed protein product [Haemonchus placei]|uniref:DDE_3 domain-containing protein n=1 Tax=Haemonchus placei TaxID=6290 RepID=A0A0N4WJG4_HAEPC|nr:unnamed protein product [Haemonchus placei]